MQKSLDYEFRGCQVPRATRSARGKGSSKKYRNDNQMCAFDLLATVAGKLLCEKETAPTNWDSSSGRTPEFVKQFNASKNYCLKTNECGPTDLDSSTSVSNEHVMELPDKVKLFKLEVCDQGSSDEGHFAARGGLKQQFCDQGSSDEGPLRIGRSCDGSVVPICTEDMKLVDKNDDGNSSECSQPISITMKMHQSSHIGDRKIRKLWKESPAVLKDGISFKNDGGKTPLFRSERKDHKRQKIQTCLPIKRRRLCGEHSLLMSHGGIGSEDVSCVVGQRACEGNRATASRTDQDTAVSSPVEVSKLSVTSTDEKVKLTIKSFKVPEFLIEVPGTATIGTLKSSVVEAVTSMLGGGMKVSILLEGKKIGDDTQTLRQTCISSSSKLDDIDFMLEPNTAVHSPKPCSSDPFPPLSPEVTQPPNRLNPLSEDSDTTHEGLTVVGSPKPVSCNSEESNCHHDVRPAELSPKEATPSSRALIPTSVATPDPLAVVSANRKPRHAELAQRRVRRPFSVAEVEALVKAVEKLGTGRWRDVKLLSFDNAKHRTYVDLKDKWKTLVHTARISPQQRRGEPVPQELLDRVLSAHAYWSQQQSKHHQVKQQQETRLLL